MKRLLALLALLWSVQSQAAITFVDCTANNATNTQTLVLTAPTGIADNDVLTVHIWSNQDTADPITNAHSFSDIYNFSQTTGGTLSGLLAYKVAASESGNYTFTADVAAIQLTGFICAWRGVDTSTPFDVTYVQGTHYASVLNDQAPPPPAITTATNGAVVVISAYADANTVITDFTESSGYTLPDQNIAGGRMSMIQYLTKATAGVETPGDITTTDGTVNDDWGITTIALKPAGAAAPTFDTSPTLDACTDTGCTFDYDGGAVADEIHAMFLSTAESTPTCAQIEAETGSNGAAGEAVTGAADTITITSTDTPEFPLYDAHFCLEEGTSNYSAVVTVADNELADPTGEQFVAVTSIGVGSAGEAFNSTETPDIASGDYLLSPDNTDPGSQGTHTGSNDAATLTNSSANWIADQFNGYTIDNDTDGSSCTITDTTTTTIVCTLSGGTQNDWDTGDSYTVTTPVTWQADTSFAYAGDSPPQRQSILNIEVYDASVGGWHASDIDIWDNNAVPSCSNLADIIIPIDTAITEIDLDDQCTDGDGDLLDFSSDTLPNGITHGATTDSNLLNGTPDTAEEVASTFTGEDIAETTDTFTANWCVYDDYTMPDITGGTISEGTTEIDAVIPCNITPSFTVEVECSASVAADDIISHVPVATTAVSDPFAAIALVVSLGEIYPNCIPPDSGGRGIMGIKGVRLGL